MSEFVSCVMLSLRNAFGIPSIKIPLDSATLVSYVLPSIASYFALAVLAVTSQTRSVRVALWPLVALLALRATLSVDMSQGKPEYLLLNSMFVVSVSRDDEPRLTYVLTSLQLFMLSAVIRSLGWTLAKGPLVRHIRPKNSPPSTIMDALDLVFTFRGHGWEWSRRLYIPRETRPTSPIAFTFHAFLSLIAHALISGVSRHAFLSLVPERAGTSPSGSTLFDESLPFLVRYLRSSVITMFAAIEIYASMQVTYDLCTIPGVLLLGQGPAQWPPAFDAPWRATSLSEFWGRRWHQFLRHIFLLTGGYPLALVLGRTGIVIGAFSACALWHHINLLTCDSQTEFWWMLVGFEMMGVGVLVERAFHRLTGRQVGGVMGWVWTMGWLILWGNVIFEGFARASSQDRLSVIDEIPPLRELVEYLMLSFDGWLHVI